MSYDIKYFTVKREFSLESLKAKSGSIPYKIYDVFLIKAPLLSYNFLFSWYKYGNKWQLPNFAKHSPKQSQTHFTFKNA